MVPRDLPVVFPGLRKHSNSLDHPIWLHPYFSLKRFLFKKSWGYIYWKNATLYQKMVQQIPAISHLSVSKHEDTHRIYFNTCVHPARRWSFFSSLWWRKKSHLWIHSFHPENNRAYPFYRGKSSLRLSTSVLAFSSATILSAPRPDVDFNLGAFIGTLPLCQCWQA